MTARERELRLELQDQFLKLCAETSQTLDEVLSDMDLPPETLAGWMADNAFRKKLNRFRKYLRQTRELHVEIGAARAAAQLTRVVSNKAGDDAKPVIRSACVDLIRLSRDANARRRREVPHVDDVTKDRDLYHPAIPADEAQAIMEELNRRER